MPSPRLAALLALLLLLPHPASAQRPLSQALADPQVAAALAAVDARRDATARWLARIGAIVSPSGQERERAEAVAAEMRRIGLADVTIDATPNVVGRIRGRSGQALVFVSTLDDLATVAAHQRAATAPPRIDGDKVVGPGTNTSTTTASLIAAADALLKSGLQPEHDLVFAAVAQEETGLVGMTALYGQWKDRALAFVDVLGDGHSVTYGAITIHWWKVVASGPGGHSLNGGVPNVNQGIGRAVDRILQLPQPERYQDQRVVINVAMLQSGGVYNHKPETGWFSLDVRSLDGARVEEVEAEVRRILAGVTTETTIAFEMQPFQITPGGQIPGLRDSALVTTAAAISSHLGYPAQLGNAGSANLNVPLGHGSVAIGIGGERGGQRGFPDEWGDIPQMMRTAKYLVLLAATIGAAPAPLPAASAAVEQKTHGTRAALPVLASFDGLGADLHTGPTPPRNPSDNSLAVGPNHIVQIVNSQLAIYTKQGAQHAATGRLVYGPIGTNALFAGHGEVCGSRANGDAVVRYDQLANRWLVVMPIFRRAVPRTGDTRATGPTARPGEAARVGQASAPGAAAPPSTPPAPPPPAPPAAPGAAPSDASYAICYAISTTPDPTGPYFRYVFERPLFPDYPRPAVWPDGYYIPTSTGDDVIQKHVCAVDRVRMLKGEPATEQCVVVDGVNFLNNADLDGTTLPPPGAPNVMMAAGGAQLRGEVSDDGIYAWKFHVDWTTPSNTRLEGPRKIAVAPYRYLCGGQLTSCVPQPGTDRRLDAQGDKLMARLIYRNLGGHQSLVAVHSVDTAAGGGGVRWYEFRLDANGDPRLHQQGTYAPDASFRWMASPAMDRRGNLALGYSFGGTPHFAGQRLAARLAGDPPGVLSFHESVLAEGAAAQTSTLRWEDYTQTAVDPGDDCTIWYVGDYLKADAASYSTRIGAFRLPGCTAR